MTENRDKKEKSIKKYAEKFYQEDRISQDGATVVNGEGVTVNGAPDGDVADSCRELGRALAGMV